MLWAETDFSWVPPYPHTGRCSQTPSCHPTPTPPHPHPFTPPGHCHHLFPSSPFLPHWCVPCHPAGTLLTSVDLPSQLVDYATFPDDSPAWHCHTPYPSTLIPTVGTSCPEPCPAFAGLGYYLPSACVCGYSHLPATCPTPGFPNMPSYQTPRLLLVDLDRTDGNRPLVHYCGFGTLPYATRPLPGLVGDLPTPLVGVSGRHHPHLTPPPDRTLVIQLPDKNGTFPSPLPDKTPPPTMLFLVGGGGPDMSAWLGVHETNDSTVGVILISQFSLLKPNPWIYWCELDLLQHIQLGHGVLVVCGQAGRLGQWPALAFPNRMRLGVNKTGMGADSDHLQATTPGLFGQVVPMAGNYPTHRHCFHYSPDLGGEQAFPLLMPPPNSLQFRVWFVPQTNKLYVLPVPSWFYYLFYSLLPQFPLLARFPG